MSKINKISGYPEWLPHEKLVEDEVIAAIRGVFSSFGFTPIETPAVELKSTLSSKGVIDKEIYVLKRALAAEGEDDEDLALHFDLTVPLARYVAQHFSELIFPFKRYQLQKVWRGDRPQKGRFREFYQFDVDIIARDSLPLACDAEIITVLDKAFGAINIAPHRVRINNRKVLLGAYESLGLTEGQQRDAIRIVDKLDKIGKEGVSRELAGALAISSEIVSRIVALTEIRAPLDDAAAKLAPLAGTSALLDSGCGELAALIEAMPAATRARCTLDLSLARGLDYYTGTIFEIFLPDHPDFGTVSSGGRYEDLASQFINRKLPGVGGSIGLSRLMDLVFRKSLRDTSRKSRTQVLVAVYSEAQRARCIELSEELRSHGLSVEVFFTSPKLGKQIDYAASKGIPRVLFVEPETGVIEAKNLETKEQVPVNNLAEWCRSNFFASE